MVRLSSVGMPHGRSMLASLALAAPLLTGGAIGGAVALSVSGASPNLTPASSNSAVATTADVTYTELVDGNAGKCLDVAGGSTANGAKVQQWGCWGGANQLWAMVPSQVPGYFTVRNLNSGKCLDVAGVSTVGNTTIIGRINGSTVQQWGCWNGPQQLWARFGPMLVNYDSVANSSGPAECLDVANASTANGARVQQWGCWNGPQQQWVAGPAGQGTTTIP